LEAVAGFVHERKGTSRRGRGYCTMGGTTFQTKANCRGRARWFGGGQAGTKNDLGNNQRYQQWGEKLFFERNERKRRFAKGNLLKTCFMPLRGRNYADTKKKLVLRGGESGRRGGEKAMFGVQIREGGRTGGGLGS